VVFLLTLPSSIGLVVLGRDMIATIFQGGKFDSYDTGQTAVALSCYAAGLAGYAGAKILNPAFYALRDSRTPMIVSLGSIAVNFAAAYATVNHTRLGHAGLALSTTSVAIFSFLALFAVIRVRIGGLYGRDLAASVAKIGMAALAMGAAVAMIHLGMERALGVSKAFSALKLLVCIPAGAAVFYAVCRAFRVAELELAMSGLLAPLRRWVLPRRGTVG
jgi:putative peptidoglycan lipid II flippase